MPFLMLLFKYIESSKQREVPMTGGITRFREYTRWSKTLLLTWVVFLLARGLVMLLMLVSGSGHPPAAASRGINHQTQSLPHATYTTHTYSPAHTCHTQNTHMHRS